MNISRGQQTPLTSGLYYLLVAILALPFILPLWWMISTAFMPPAALYAATPQWIPQALTLQNFSRAWKLMDFPRFIANSLLITGLAMSGTLLSSSVAGFAFAVLPGRGKQPLFLLLLATMMTPPFVTLLPLFILFSKLGWINTYLPLIVPHFFANAFYVFLFRQFYRGLPADLFESAEIDGCNPLGTYWWIALPLSRPVLSTVAIFSFIGTWNSFLEPLVYLSTNEKFTISLGLSMFNGIYYTQMHYLMPMSLVALLPVLAIFIFAQRYLVQGMVTTGIKG